MIHYLKRTIHSGLTFYKSSSLQLLVFNDVEWVGFVNDRRSIGAFCVFLIYNLISWHSGKQRTFLCSSIESKYKDLVSIASELLWLKSLLSELFIHVQSSLVIFYNNKSATTLAQNPINQACTKYIENTCIFNLYPFMKS